MPRDISRFILYKGKQELGITWYDIKHSILTPEEYTKFENWMQGSTVGCVDDSCTTTVVYTCDLLKFLRGEVQDD